MKPEFVAALIRLCLREYKPIGNFRRDLESLISCQGQIPDVKDALLAQALTGIIASFDAEWRKHQEGYVSPPAQGSETRKSWDMQKHERLHRLLLQFARESQQNASDCKSPDGTELYLAAFNDAFNQIMAVFGYEHPQNAAQPGKEEKPSATTD